MVFVFSFAIYIFAGHFMYIIDVNCAPILGSLNFFSYHSRLRIFVIQLYLVLYFNFSNTGLLRILI